MGLAGSERKKLRQAIINAYPSKAKLKMMVSDELEENLDAIAGGENLDEIVFNFIEWAESQGKLETIIDAAIRTNPGNEELKEFQQSTPNELTEIVNRILDGNRDEKDIAKLKEFLQMDGNGLEWKSQNGKFINNIGQITAGEVQFGDRTYYGTDAETIKTVILEALPEIIQKIGVENPSQSKNVNTEDDTLY